MWRRSRAHGPWLAAALVGFVLRSAACAADSEVEELRRQVDELRRSVEELKANAAQPGVSAARAASPVKGPDQDTNVSGGGASPVARNPASPPAPMSQLPVASSSAVARSEERESPDLLSLRRAWRQVQPGIPAASVEERLGPPSRQLKINGKRMWYYIYPDLGAGSVFFNDNGLVSSSRSPSLGRDW